jgi:hypothetical protein
MNLVLGVLSDYFINSMLSDSFFEWFGYGWSWPPCSPHLVPCDYFYGFQKDTVYKNNPHTIREVKQEILLVVIITHEGTLAAVV